jgi:hypothetical protein
MFAIHPSVKLVDEFISLFVSFFDSLNFRRDNANSLSISQPLELQHMKPLLSCPISGPAGTCKVWSHEAIVHKYQSISELVLVFKLSLVVDVFNVFLS